RDRTVTGVQTCALPISTRIELKTVLAEFKLRGVVASLDTNAKTFVIGAATIGYAGVAATDLPALANGLLVRVTLQPAQQGGVWIDRKSVVEGKCVDDLG